MSYLVTYRDIYFEANTLTVQLIRSLQTAKTMDEGIHLFLATHPRYTYAQTKIFIDGWLLPKINGKRQTVKKFLYQYELVPPNQINKLSGFFGLLFHSYVLFPSLCASIVAIYLFFLYSGNVMTFTSRMGAGELIILLILLICASVFHEIGQASAARYFGVESGEIGIGLYLNFPVLYTDVSNIRKLPLKQRCIVNIAGVYFQSILLVILIDWPQLQKLWFLYLYSQSVNHNKSDTSQLPISATRLVFYSIQLNSPWIWDIILSNYFQYSYPY